MKIHTWLLLASSITASLAAPAQTIQGYTFQRYPAQVAAAKKTPVQLASNPLGTTYRTAITQQYATRKINFAGHYITTIWGAGTGQTLGAMVDVHTGKIYELPLSEDNSNRGVYHDNNNNIFYHSTSNLFVCYASSANPADEQKVNLTYYFYRWDVAKTKFLLLGTRKVTTALIDE